MNTYEVRLIENFGSIKIMKIFASAVELVGDYAVFKTHSKVVAIIKSPISVTLTNE